VNLGIYGGTFDPLHSAHLIIAESARQQFQLDKVCFIPGFIPPHKQQDHITDAGHRLNMVKIAIAGNPHFELSDWEILKQGTSFTIDTIEFFAGKHQLDADHLFLIIGADNLADFSRWKNPNRIIRMVTLLVAARAGCDLLHQKNPMAIPYHLIDAPKMDISSTMIRLRISQGKSIRYLVPDSIHEYIENSKLYA